MMRRAWRSSLAVLLLWVASGCNAIPITVPHDDNGVDAPMVLGDGGMTDRGLIQDAHLNGDILWPSGDLKGTDAGMDAAGMDGTTDALSDALSDAVGEGVPLLDSLGEGLLDTGMLD